jgi:excisionase family DNA binding protein
MVPSMADAHPAIPAEPRWLTKEEVADWLRLTPRTVQRMAHDGRLTAYGNGNIIRFREDEVRNFLQPLASLEEQA